MAVIYTSLPPLVPVFNQLPWGVERLADKIMIFVPLLLAGSIFLFNIIFSQLMYEKMPLVIRMIGITTFFISFSTFIFIIRTTLLVL